MFNSDVLGYKVRKGDIRKHSEQLNKWLAGFIDADGSFSLHLKKNSNGKVSVYLQLTICQSASNDPDFELLRSLAFYYQLGSIYFGNRENDIKRSESASWHFNSKDTKILFGRIGKHLRIKATHAENLIWLVNELDGVSIAPDCIEELREFSKCSRGSSRWLKMPKHPSWAWLAGYLDGDGHYRCRINRTRTHKDGHTNNSNELKLFVGTSEQDSFILNFLHVHLGGSIRTRKDGVRFWQRSLGAGSAAFAVPFIKKMLQYTCIEKKYIALQKMLDFHTTRRD